LRGRDFIANLFAAGGYAILERVRGSVFIAGHGYTMSRGKEKTTVLTVTQLTRRIKSVLEERFTPVWVAGEISNLRRPASGHLYFTLKDEESQIAAVMFKGRNLRLKFEPEDGLAVVVCGGVSVYERRGNYQIIVEELEPKGVGALQLAFEQLKEKLDKEGLFDPAHKVPLPVLPQRIGVVTSSTGAAIRDILNVIDRRFSNVHVLICPVLVQGEGAAAEIAGAVRDMDRMGAVDVLIVGRGGGSLEDLWAFNEEMVARAIYECRTPVISAVGHEIDFTIADFVADLRAPTPSAAAELVVGERDAMLENVEQIGRRLAGAVGQRVADARRSVEMLANSYVFKRPLDWVRELEQNVDELSLSLSRNVNELLGEWRSKLDRLGSAVSFLSPLAEVRRSEQQLLDRRGRLYLAARNATGTLRNSLSALADKLESLSPLAVLGRGYSLAWKLPEKVLVRDASVLAPRDKVRLQMHKGSAVLAVEKVYAGDGGTV